LPNNYFDFAFGVQLKLLAHHKKSKGSSPFHLKLKCTVKFIESVMKMTPQYRKRGFHFGGNDWSTSFSN